MDGHNGAGAATLHKWPIRNLMFPPVSEARRLPAQPLAVAGGFGIWDLHALLGMCREAERPNSKESKGKTLHRRAQLFRQFRPRGCGGCHGTPSQLRNFGGQVNPDARLLMP